MPKIRAALAAIAALIFAHSLPAHGGTYMGPIAGNKSPPRVAGGGAAPTKTGTTPVKAGLQIKNYDRAWFIWWEFNKGAYINRDRRVAGEKTPANPTGSTSARMALDRGYVEQSLVPAFVSVLKRGSGNRELITGSLIALARLRPKDEVIPTIAAYMKKNQEYEETAALALGISGSKSALPILMALAANDKSARKWIRGSRVGYRTRSFALYGLGLWCRQNANNYASSQALAVVLRIIEVESKSNRRKLRKDTEVAALQAIRLIVGGVEGVSGDLLRKDGLRCLVAYIQDKKKKDVLLRSHAVNALGETLGRNEDPTGQVKKLLVSILNDRKAPAMVHQSAVISVGRMGRLDDDDLLECLDRYTRKGRDGHAKNLALIAMARIASDEARDLLLNPGSRIGGPWAVIALAVLDVERRKRFGTNEVDKTIGERLMQSSRGAFRMTGANGALAIAIGVQGYLPAVDRLEGGLNPKLMTNDSAYLALALGLLGAKSSEKKIRKMADRALEYPVLFTRIATALGQLGHEGLGDHLVRQLRSRKYTVEKASVALALGNVGGVAEADQLIKVMKSSRQEDLVRGFAAIALGMMGEPTKRPWHYDLLSGINYIAQTETLAGSGNGVLEIF